MSVLSFLLLELPVRRTTLSQIAQRLGKNGAIIGQRLTTLEDSPRNRQVLSHMIGIERQYLYHGLASLLGYPRQYGKPKNEIIL